MATARPRPQVMRLSEAAAARIKELMAKADRPIAGVRVGVKNGGCAGMEYTMEYVESIGPTDEVVEDKGVKLLIDPKAVLFLLGTEMDWKVGKLSSQFVFNNPNQTSACGCGESVLLTPAKARAAPRRTELPGGCVERRRRSRSHHRAVCRLRPGRGAPHVQRRGRLCRRPDDRAGGRRRDLSQSRRQLRPAVRAGRAGAVQLQDPGRQAHAEFVLADAGAALRRAGRTCANGRGMRWRRRGAATNAARQAEGQSKRKKRVSAR